MNTLRGKKQVRAAIGVLLLTAVCFLVGGCATIDDEASASANKPWNAPKGWESGLPVGLSEGR